LGLDFPKLPYLITGDHKVADSAAVHRYIAAKYSPETLGSTPEIQCNINMIWDVVHPLRFRQFTNEGAFLVEDFELAKREAVPALKQLTLWLKDKFFLGGNELTWVDFYGFELMELIDLVWQGKFSHSGQDSAFYKQYPVLRAYHDRIASIERIQRYLGRQKAEEKEMEDPLVTQLREELRQERVKNK